MIYKPIQIYILSSTITAYNRSLLANWQSILTPSNFINFNSAPFGVQNTYYLYTMESFYEAITHFVQIV